MNEWMQISTLIHSPTAFSNNHQHQCKDFLTWLKSADEEESEEEDGEEDEEEDDEDEE